MINTLHIKNIGIIDELSVDLNKGFNVLTGETGAGKTLIIDSLEIFSLLANVADVKSLVIHPATTTHSQLTDEELVDQGITRQTVRLSIGTENIDDILFDLENAFNQI